MKKIDILEKLKKEQYRFEDKGEQIVVTLSHRLLFLINIKNEEAVFGKEQIREGMPMRNNHFRSLSEYALYVSRSVVLFVVLATAIYIA